MTSNSFDVNVLSQVQALDRKPAVSKEFADLKRRQAVDARKKGADHGKNGSKERDQKGGMREDPILSDDMGTKIDITV
jgi:hypothetical protein